MLTNLNYQTKREQYETAAHYRTNTKNTTYTDTILELFEVAKS